MGHRKVSESIQEIKRSWLFQEKYEGWAHNRQYACDPFHSLASLQFSFLLKHVLGGSHENYLRHLFIIYWDLVGAWGSWLRMLHAFCYGH